MGFRKATVSEELSDFYESEKTFFNHMERLINHLFNKDGPNGTYGTLKKNGAILKNNQTLSKKERDELAKLLEPYKKIVNLGSPYGNRPLNDVDAARKIFSVLTSENSYLNAMIECSRNFHALTLLTSKLQSLPPDKANSRAPTNIDSIIIMAGQRLPRVELSGKEIMNLSGKNNMLSLLGKNIFNTSMVLNEKANRAVKFIPQTAENTGIRKQGAPQSRQHAAASPSQQQTVSKSGASFFERNKVKHPSIPAMHSSTKRVYATFPPSYKAKAQKQTPKPPLPQIPGISKPLPKPLPETPVEVKNMLNPGRPLPPTPEGPRRKPR